MTNLDYLIDLLTEHTERKFSAPCALCKLKNPNYCILNESCPEDLEIYEWLKEEYKEEK